MEEKIKEIVSVFTKIPVDQIGPATPIGRSAMQSSILLHRMYARLAEEGLAVDNYGNIKIFADLLTYGPGQTSGSAVSDRSGHAVPDGSGSAIPANGQTGISGTSLSADLPARTNLPPVPAVMDTSVTTGIGIDIEEVAGLPLTNDFRKEEFYKMNFTAAEIAYCILQPDPYSSFTGLFAAKEAIIKADGRYQFKIFNSIEIGHSPEGKPVYPGFELSISHAGKMAVAVAVPSGGNAALWQAPPASAGQTPAPVRKGSPAAWLAVLALALSAIALIIVLTHWHE
jgi:phosphopantetheine--protein transferase-like protein